VVKILSVENSTVEGSLSWLVDGEERATCRWSNHTRRDQRFFLELERMLEEQAIEVAEIDALVVGRGPGNFSGMRTAQAALQGLALPNKTPVIAISSGAALAWACLQELEPGTSVSIVGDARRETLWYGAFELQQEQLTCLSDWRTVDVRDQSEILHHPTTHVVTSELERVQALFHVGELTSRYPEAAWLGRLALEQLHGRREAETLGPIYLHPAVPSRT
jgi:tRNA threonylcarbamoyladenosine biosynthesis protein TsaB